MISLDWTLLYQMGLFVALMIFLGKFLFQPILAVFEARDKAHLEPASMAEKLSQQADEALIRYKDLMSQARKKGEKIRNDLLGEASKREKEIVSNAQKQSLSTIEAARKEIESARESLARDLPKEAGDLAGQLTEKLLGR